MEKYEEEAEKTAFERAKAAYGSGAYDDATLEFLFPELKESENEKVRKFLIGYFDKLVDKNSEWGLTEETRDRILTWLEKQKENTEKEYVFEYVFRPLAGTDITIAAEQAIRRAKEGHHLVLAFNGAYIPVRKGNNAKDLVDIYDAYLEKQKENTEELICRLNRLMQEFINESRNEEEREHSLKCYNLFWDALEDISYFDEQKEQKPAEWNDSDKLKLRQTLECFEYLSCQCKAECVSWLKALPERFNFRPKQEWSEEDEKHFISIINDIKQDAIPDEEDMNWFKTRFKSIRPQPHWKPTEEQMEHLKMCFSHGKPHLPMPNQHILESLYNDLKKLM